MTTPDQLRHIVEFLENRIYLVVEGEGTIAFSPPTAEEMAAAGLDRATATRLTSTSWWPEMVGDIIETPEFAEPDASPEVVLGYARDVIREHIGKRFSLDE